jgi:formylglycine-generating enzyme required for sulfatase activity
MRAHRGYRWILLMALASGACIPDVSNDKPGVCMPGQARCMGPEVQTCGPDYQWHDGQTCAGTMPYCAGGACSAEPPSCQGLPAQCGPIGAQDCCMTLPVKGGTLQRVDHSYGAADGGASSSAMVSDFALDRFEVTVGRFRRFVAFLQTGSPIPAGSGAPPAHPGDGWQSAWNAMLTSVPSALDCDLHPTWTSAPGDGDTLPINCVNWYAAFAFCAWDGGRLPTEAEWEYAATLTASMAQHVYPWGDGAPSDALAVYCSSASATDQSPCADGTNPIRIGNVGSKSPAGDGPWGHADLAGNVWEWTMDSKAPYPSSCDDCVSFPETNGDRQIRGGAYNYGAYALPGGLRTNFLETQPRDKIGIRCARSP